MLLSFRNLFAQLFRLVDKSGCVLLVLLKCRDFFRSLVALSFQRFSFGDGGAAFEIDSVKVVENGRRIHAALAQFFFDKR